ncbi:MAG: hypothetical protein J0L86_09675 [Flavobacteriales bacterium]|nr:hypothetical protein [Flavobacteriales bacterium]
MDDKKRTSYLLLIIGVLVLALAGAIGYIVGDFNSSKQPTNSISTNEEVMKEIEELKSMYDSKIAEKTTSFQELKEEKKKVASLMYELEKTKSDANSLIKYKTQYQQLESKMRVLVNEIVALKSGKTNAVAKVKSTKLPDNNSVKTTTAFSKKETSTVANPKVTNTPKKETPKTNFVTPTNTVNETPVVVQPKAQPKVEEVKVEEFRVSNLKALAYITKSSGKQEETVSASKAKMLRVSFVVSGNSGKNQEDKTYYIQVINSKNNVMGKKITEFFGDKSLTYSFSKTVDVSDGTATVTQDFFDADFEKGTYFINIFDHSKLVGNSSITLK